MVNAKLRPPYHRERSSTLCTGGWVDRRHGLDGGWKMSPQLEFDPRTVQPVVSLYVD